MSFNSNCDSKWFLSLGFIAEICRSLGFFKSSMDSYPVVKTITVSQTSWLDCLRKQSRVFWGMLGRKQVLWPRHSLDVQHFFQLLLPFGIIQLRSHQLHNGPWFITPKNLLIALVFVRSWFGRKLNEFTDKTYRDNPFFRKVFCF